MPLSKLRIRYLSKIEVTYTENKSQLDVFQEYTNDPLIRTLNSDAESKSHDRELTIPEL